MSGVGTSPFHGSSLLHPILSARIWNGRRWGQTRCFRITYGLEWDWCTCEDAAEFFDAISGSRWRCCVWTKMKSPVGCIATTEYSSWDEVSLTQDWLISEASVIGKEFANPRRIAALP